MLRNSNASLAKMPPWLISHTCEKRHSVTGTPPAGWRYKTIGPALIVGSAAQSCRQGPPGLPPHTASTSHGGRAAVCLGRHDRPLEAVGEGGLGAR
jgi:hypothetical protein